MTPVKGTRRPVTKDLVGKPFPVVPASLQRILAASDPVDPIWVGPEQAVKLPRDEFEAYELAHRIMCHLCVQAPTKHKSGHPGGPLSSFTFAYLLAKRRDPSVDQPLRMSAGHLSVLAYGLQWLLGREGNDPRLQSPQAIIDTFRTPSGLPGHAEAGIGNIPFGAGPLGKGVSNGLGAAFGLKYLGKPGAVDVLMADGDCQEGQVMEAFRLASHLKISNLVVHGDFNDVQLSDLPSRTVAADFARIAAATGWQVIEVQNGNDPGQVVAALELADSLRCHAEEGVRPSRSTAPRSGATLRPSRSLLGQAQCDMGKPTFLCYYTTMGHGVKVMEEGSNTGKENFHGTPLKSEVAAEALKALPPLEDLIKAYKPYREAEKKRYTSKPPVKTDIELPWKLPKGYKRAVTTEKGSARQDFGKVHLKNLMKDDPRIVVLHADLAGSGGFDPDSFENSAEAGTPRIINVGVAEANMVMMAAGMRQVGLLPITYTFAAFGTNEARANMRLIDINCSHTRCAVLYDCTHAGVNVGEDGETHQEQNYVNLPFHHTQVWCPGDSNQAGAMAEAALAKIAEGHTSVAVMMPRLGHPQIVKSDGKPFYDANYEFTGKAEVIRSSTCHTEEALSSFEARPNGLAPQDDTSESAVSKCGQGDVVTILSYGIALHKCMEAVEQLEKAGVKIRLINVSCIRPLDKEAVIKAAKETKHLIVVEDHNVEGGLASRVADVVADHQLHCSLRRIGLTRYYPSGTGEELLTLAGISTNKIVEAVTELLNEAPANL